MSVIQITIRCVAHKQHAKILRLHESVGAVNADIIAQILDGTSPFYFHKPGALSPIGKCATCGSQLTSEVVGVNDAEND